MLKRFPSPRAMNRCWRLCLLSFVAAMTGASESVACEEEVQREGAKHEASADVETVLRWLPMSTKTLSVVREPVDTLEFDESTADRLPVYLTGAPLTPLNEVFGRKFLEMVPLADIKFMVDARELHAPPPHFYLGCHVYAIDATRVDAVKKNVQAALAEAKVVAQEELEGYEVTRIDFKDRRGIKRFRVTWVDDNLLVIATDRDYLKAMLANARGGDRKDRLLDDEETRQALADTKEAAFVTMRRSTSKLMTFIFTYTPGDSSPNMRYPAVDDPKYREFHRAQWEVKEKLPEFGKRHGDYDELILNHFDKKTDEADAFLFTLVCRLEQVFFP